VGLKAGIVGLPNVGKSTLFNALTDANVPAENYPFCTIKPHTAITHVPDQRLEKLQKIYQSAKIIPATVTFVDIAGLVKGAASGEGLGNAFLNTIREVDLILHVLRCFECSNTTENPLNDYAIIMQELIYKDLESIEKRTIKLEKNLKKIPSHGERKTVLDELNLLKTVQNELENSNVKKAKEHMQKAIVQTIPLLCTKRSLIIANLNEKDIENQQYKKNKQYQQLEQTFGSRNVVPICAKLAYELSQLDEHETLSLMEMLNIQSNGISTIIQQTYSILDLITFFTAGPEEVHAWPIPQGTAIKQAAGGIHSDLENGFICAEVFNCNDLFACNNVSTLKKEGKLRIEGQNYLVKDGDIIHIRHNPQVSRK